ncbi:flagellar assembly protein FliH [Variovorax ginsengisoli]|uniref:Flagellar assembly protein FliH n=1 Tax=Variovorax ginsengisoli TaxID=363844 RepID=A0ABT9SEU6_9BURK|nr:flagellar assembly protein FliH [Variovorax ginsengisoli]MDP9902298.1 flagellar assembly protein FliH [Variovorax ginsengisoli]
MTSFDTSAGSSPRGRLAAAYTSSSAASATPGRSQGTRPWQLWEMANLGTSLDNQRTRTIGPTTPAHAMQPLPVQEYVPSAADLERLRALQESTAAAQVQGRLDGWTQGHAEGYTEGIAAGLAGASAHAQQLLRLAESLPAALKLAEADVSDAIVALALNIARRVVHRTLEADPEWVLPWVREALRSEPALTGEPRLMLHPEDIALVTNSLGSELQVAGWHLCADASIARGGCRVVTSSGERDATLETRWHRVATAVLATTQRAGS